MSDATPRLDLPYIVPGQAQKELFHNEALLRLDSLVQAAVEDASSADPPDEPTEGQCWIVGEAATGAWTGKDHQLAASTGDGWRFAAPTVGSAVWDKAAEVERRWDGTAWSDGRITCSGVFVGGDKVVGARRAAIASPSGGTIIDAEARGAIEAIIATLMSHGLTE
jgi:hypothetical protein